MREISRLFCRVFGYPGRETGKHRIRKVGQLLLVSAVSAGVLVPTLQRDAAAAARLDGVVSDVTWYITRAEMDRSIALLQQAGVKTIRANVNWAALEPNTRGAFDSWWLAEIDYAVAKAHAAGIDVLMPISDGVPYWASADPNKHTDASGTRVWNKNWKPASMTDYANFVSAIVKRYAPKGVHAYEVWNEPNNARFWPSGVSAADYVGMLKATYPAVKAADPSATVITGGLSKNDYAYVQAMYAAGAKGYFDALAVHPYTGSVDPTWCWNQGSSALRAVDAFCGIESVRAVMVDNYDAAKDIWLTEFGWSTATSADYGVTEAAQAEFLTKAFEQLAAYPYVTRAYWYAGRNLYSGNDNPGDLEANYGLTRVDFSLKPSYTAFKNSHSSATTTSTTAPTATTSTTAPAATTTTTAPPTTTSTTSTTVGASTTTTAATDRTAPKISSVAARSITKSSATITWTTNEASDSVVEYWPSGGAIRTASNASRVTAHSVPLSGLSTYTLYYFRVKSKDAAGNVATSGTASFRTKRS